MKSEKKELCPVCKELAIMIIDDYGKVKTKTCIGCGETTKCPEETFLNNSVMTMAVFVAATVET